MVEHFRATFPGTRPTIYPNSVILHGIQLKFSMRLRGKYFPYLAHLFNRPRTSTHTHTHTHTHCHQNESSEVREKQCPPPGTALSSFNRIKLIIMQLCFKFNFIGVDVKTLPCLHAACRKYNHHCQQYNHHCQQYNHHCQQYNHHCQQYNHHCQQYNHHCQQYNHHCRKYNHHCQQYNHHCQQYNHHCRKYNHHCQQYNHHCQQYNHHCQRCLFTDSRARIQPRCLPNIPCLPRSSFSYENSTPISAVQSFLDLATEILISCRSPGCAARTQIAIPSRKAVTFATLNPLLTLTNSHIAFCNDKQT